MKKIISVLIVLFMVIGASFAFDMTEDKEQFQFTFFDGIEDSDENSAMGITFYPEERYCLMYHRDYSIAGEEGTQILAYGGFKYDPVNDPYYIYATLLDTDSDVIEIELEIVSDYELSGYVKIAGGFPERVTLRDRYFILVQDQIDALVTNVKNRLLSE